MASSTIMVLLGLLFLYPYVFYPILAKLLSRRSSRPAAAEGPDSPIPSLALVVCALNEERVIRAKVENCLALDYPKERLHIVFVSDGSTDRTASIIAEYSDRGVELIQRRQRQGKVANLNDVVPQLNQEIVVLSDANVIYDAKALLRLVERFADPTVGAASGKVVLCNTTEEFRSSEQSYYSIEWSLQELASYWYSMVGVDGGMYAFRRELFVKPPNDTLIEDFVIAIGIVRRGRRIVFVPEAIAWEDGPTSLREEYRRKVRIAAGAAQALLRGNGWPRGAPARFWFIFISHKLLRWCSPIIALAALIAAAVTWREPLSRLALVSFMVIAGLAAFRGVTGRKTRLLNAVFYFAFGQCAVLNGLMKGVTGRQSVLWVKENR